MRVIIADDEEIIRTGVVELIDWDGLGYEVAGEAEDGEEALALINEQHPDVVITDIKMPFVTGLELLKKIREMPVPPYTILLTGYEEFKFAQEAINNGAYAYLLKPIETENLERILSEIKADHDRKMAVKVFLKELRTELGIKKQMFGLSGTDDISELLREIGYDPGELYFNVMIIEIDDHLRLSQLKHSNWLESAKTRLFDLIRSESDQTKQSVIAENRGFSFTIVSWDLDSDKLKTQNKQMVQEIRAHIAEGELQFTIAAGSMYRGTHHIRTSYEEAIQALSLKFTIGQNRNIFFEDYADQLKKQRNVILDVEDIAARLSFESRESVISSFDRIINNIHEKGAFSALYVQLVITNIYICALQVLQRAEVDIEKFIGNPLHKYEAVLQYETIEERVSGLKKLIIDMYEVIENSRTNAFAGVIAHAENFIMDNFGNKSLSLGDVIKYIGMSQGQFCAEFKKKTGETFIDYLTRLRLEKGRELLTLSDRRVYEISEMVGYDNATYFSTLFKKQYGVSPSEFKTLLRRNK